MSVATPKRQLTSRKSYSILPTVDGASGGNFNGSPQWAHGGDRILSETTGLVKFSLSPNRTKKTLTTKKSGLPVYIPIDDRSSHEVEEVNILEKFAKKQRQLVELEKQIELVKFELMEMSEQIKSSHGDVNNSSKCINNGDSSNSSTSTCNSTGNAISAASRTVESPSKLNFLKNKASNIFNIEIQPSQTQPIQEYFNKFQNQFNQSKVIPRDALKNIVNDVGKNIDENNTKIKQFINANPTTKKFNELINNLSPTRASTVVTPTTRRDVAETSLMFDNLDLNEIKLEKSIIYEGGESIIFEGEEEVLGNSSSIVDIDDYDSEEENL